LKTLFDTSILVAALIEAHPKHNAAFSWLEKAKASEFEFVISSNTLADIYSV